MFGPLSDIYRLQGRSRRFLKSLGLINPAQVRAKAFARLQAGLFRLDGVEVVAVHGSAIWDSEHLSSIAEVQVVTSPSSKDALVEEVERIFLEINLRYDVSMIAILADRNSTRSLSDSRQPTQSPAQVRIKTAANTTTASIQR